MLHSVKCYSISTAPLKRSFKDTGSMEAENISVITGKVIEEGKNDRFLLEVFCHDNELQLGVTNFSSLNHSWVRFAEISNQRSRNSAHGEVPPVFLICFTHTTFHNQNSCSAMLRRAGLEELHALL